MPINRLAQLHSSSGVAGHLEDGGWQTCKKKKIHQWVPVPITLISESDLLSINKSQPLTILGLILARHLLAAEHDHSLCSCQSRSGSYILAQ